MEPIYPMLIKYPGLIIALLLLCSSCSPSIEPSSTLVEGKPQVQEIEQMEDNSQTQMGQQIVREIIEQQLSSNENDVKPYNDEVRLLFKKAPKCDPNFKLEVEDLHSDICDNSVHENFNNQNGTTSDLKCVVCNIQYSNDSTFFITINYSEGSHSTDGYYLTSYQNGTLTTLALIGEWYGSEVFEKTTLFSLKGDQIDVQESSIDRSAPKASPVLKTRTLALNSINR